MRIPTEVAFVTGTNEDGEIVLDDFCRAPELADIGRKLLNGPVSHLNDGQLRIDYRWKLKGGSTGGNPTLGKCVKLSGAAKHYAGGADFLVWLAANWCEVEGFSDRQIEALVYHELLHITRTEKEDKDGETVVKYGVRGHDVEMFMAEMEQYGAWDRSLQRLEEVVRQLPLPMEALA